MSDNMTKMERDYDEAVESGGYTLDFYAYCNARYEALCRDYAKMGHPDDAPSYEQFARDNGIPF